MLTTNKITQITLLFLCIISLCKANNDTIQFNKSTLLRPYKFVNDGYTISKENQEEAITHFRKGAQYYKAKNDTVNYVSCILGISNIEKRKGQFNKAFDILWELQNELHHFKDPISLMNLNQRLGMLYGVYGKDSLALLHLKKGLELGKKQASDDKLVSTYFEIAVQYDNMAKYDDAIQYLDSCYFITRSNRRLIFIDAYYGKIFTQKKSYHKAKAYFKDLNERFSKNNMPFQAKLYAFEGDYFLALNNNDSAIFYYNKSLNMIDSLHAHIEIKPQVLEKLAHLYFDENDKTAAFNFMVQHKNISDSLFHTQSKQNKQLFEIKSKYQEDLSQKNNLIIAQTELIESKDRARLSLQIIIGFLVSFSIVGFVIIRMRTRIKGLAHSQAIEQEKNNAIVELKNKELTANALEFIEKENKFNELLEVIKEDAPDKYPNIIKKHQQNNSQIWEDFHLRFTQTNDQFYKKLMADFPKLTQTDLKHCALIRLNFDSKEMSHILGISLHSVHMARSRVRKKLGLKREDSLGSFLASV